MIKRSLSFVAYVTVEGPIEIPGAPSPYNGGRISGNGTIWLRKGFTDYGPPADNTIISDCHILGNCSMSTDPYMITDSHVLLHGSEYAPNYGV